MSHQLGLHRDPADRMIVATAIINQAKLLTVDQKILDWDTHNLCIDARI